MIARDYLLRNVLDQIKTYPKLYNKKGGLNPNVTSSENFLESKFREDIIKLTDFLPDTSNIPERIYCLANGIVKRLTCACNRELFFEGTIKGYCKACHKCARVVRGSWGDHTKPQLEKLESDKDKLISYVNDPNSIEASLEDIIEHITNRKKSTRQSIAWIKRDELYTKLHIIKGIINNTKYISLSKDDFLWPRRCYNIINNNHTDTICRICNVNKTSFINFFSGYHSVCGDKKCSKTANSEARIKNHLEQIRPSLMNQGFTMLYNEYDYMGTNHGNIKLKCNVCNLISYKNLSDGVWKNVYCSGCFGDKNKSHQEKSVGTFLEKYNFDILENQKIFTGTKKDVDFLVPDKQIAIEYNGSQWHSFGKFYPKNNNLESKRKFNHIYKTDLCIDMNIKLFHVFSHDWVNLRKRKIWMSILDNQFGVSQKIYARKCEIVELSDSDSKEFLEENHLLGMCNSKVRIGLKYNNSIVSIMTFTKCRFNKKYEWEMNRFCSLLGHVVVGGASKLIKFFICNHKPNNILTYADRTYSNGNLFKILGFNHIKNTDPSYVYTKNDKILSRFSTQKNKQKHLLENFDANLSEVENMYNNRYRRLWNSGYMMFVWSK